MNVQYIKKYTDQHGKTFQCGWTAEHDDPEAEKRIKLGVCKQMPKGTFSRKNTTMEPPTECATMPQTRFKDIAIDELNTAEPGATVKTQSTKTKK